MYVYIYMYVRTLIPCKRCKYSILKTSYCEMLWRLRAMLGEAAEGVVPAGKQVTSIHLGHPGWVLPRVLAHANVHKTVF